MINRCLQTIYIGILDPIYRLTANISEKHRDTLLKCGIWLIFIYFIIVRSPVLAEKLMWSSLPTRSARYLFGTMLLVFVIIFSIDSPLKKVRWRSVIIIPMVLIGAGALFVSFLHPVGDGYRLFGVQLLLVFPCFYIVWNNRRGYEELFRTVTYAMTGCGIGLYILSFILAFGGRLTVDGGRLSGIMFNWNCFSLVGMELVLGAIYLLVTERTSLFKYCYAGITIGMGIGIILEGLMRIAVLLVFICTAVSIFYYLRYFRKKPDRKTWRCISAMLALMIVMMFATDAMADINERAIMNKQQGAATQEVKTASLDTVAADADMIKTAETEEENDGLSGDLNDLKDRFSIREGQDANSFTSGRIEIWKNYASKLSMLGNDYDEFDPSMTVTIAPYAHNMFLEVAYRCGIPVGLMTLVLLLFCGLVCLRYLFVNDGHKKPYLLFPIISVIVFVMESMLDCAVLPFFQAEAFLYYLSIAVIIDARE